MPFKIHHSTEEEATYIDEVAAKLDAVYTDRMEAIRHGKIVGRQARFNFAYYRCLLLPGDHKGLLIIEDDCIVKPGMVSYLLNAVNEIEAAGSKNYVLSLNAHNLHTPSRTDVHLGEYYASYCLVFGTQAMFFRTEIAHRFAPILYDRLSLGAGDEILARFSSDMWGESRTNKAGGYVTFYDQVEHIGEKSTGLGGGWCWCSTTFGLPNMTRSEYLARCASSSSKGVTQ